MGNTAPKRQFQPNQPVVIVGSDVSLEHVPEELKKFGQGAYVVKSSVMMKSRPNAPDIGVTRVKFPNGKDELFLTNDLLTVEEAKNYVPQQYTPSPPRNGYNTGSRILNQKLFGN